MEKQLLQRAREGDSASFEALVTPHEEMLWRLCWHYTHSEADAADCLQDSMIKAWRTLPSFREDCALRTWLYRICTSCCLDFLRRRKRQAAPLSVEELAEQHIQLSAAGSTPEEAALEQAWVSAVAAAVDELPAHMREALILTQLEGISYEEAAAVSGVSTGTVKSRVNRARQRLKEKLAAWREPSGRRNVQSDEGGKPDGTEKT